MQVKVPSLAEGISSGTIVSILVAEGDSVSKEQTLMELETDKAIAPVPSPVAGKVSNILVAEGDSVSIGQAILELEGAAGAEVSPPAIEEREAPPHPAQSATAAPRATAPTAAPHTAPKGFPPPASPSLRKAAAEFGIDLQRVAGSGPGGRISSDDVQRYISELQSYRFGEQSSPQAAAPELQAEVDFSLFGPVSRQPMSGLRQKIAERMSASWEAVVHVTQLDEANLTTLNQVRKQYKARYLEEGANLTVTVLIVKSLVDTLKEHRLFSASIDAARQEVIIKEYLHLGLAVDTKQGLIVPVIRDVDQLSVLELAKQIAELAEKARSRKVTIDELRGACFTISNQGGIGGQHFTPIVNSPETAILGVGQARQRAVVQDDKIAPALVLPLALSYDHRLIDGASAARFISDLVARIENFEEAALEL